MKLRAKRRFKRGGEYVYPGQEYEGPKADVEEGRADPVGGGNAPSSGTGAEQQRPTAAALQEEIQESTDRARLEELLQDDRKTVQKAAQKRIEELDAESSGPGDDPANAEGGDNEQAGEGAGNEQT